MNWKMAIATLILPTFTKWNRWKKLGEYMMAAFEDERLATAARYVSASRELELTLDDGSRHLIPVDRLEMVERVAFKPLFELARRL